MAIKSEKLSYEYVKKADVFALLQMYSATGEPVPADVLASELAKLPPEEVRSVNTMCKHCVSFLPVTWACGNCMKHGCPVMFYDYCSASKKRRGGNRAKEKSTEVGSASQSNENLSRVQRSEAVPGDPPGASPG